MKILFGSLIALIWAFIVIYLIENKLQGAFEHESLW